MVSTQSPNQSVKITKTVVDRTPFPASGQAFLRDTALRGFALRLTAGGARSFVVEKRIEGRVVRKTLGSYGELTVEQARREAQKFLGKVAQGLNPIAEKEHARIRTTTLARAFEDFKSARKDLKPRTLYDYTRLIEVALGEWQSRPLVSLTKEQIAKRHQELGQNSGEAYANLTMRFLRSLFNFALAHYEDGFGRPLLTENPVARLTQTRSWYRSERRQTVIKVHQLPAFYAAVEALRGDSSTVAETVADFLLLLLFTGLRRQEAAQLTWDRIDLSDRTLLIPDPKNRERFVLPLSSFVVALLERRYRAASNAYVFQGEGPHGYLVEPKRQIAKVVQASDLNFTLHDLRRTFITVAESIDIPPYAIKRLVNHKMRNDVTAGYIVADVERLRLPMQQVTDYLLKATGAMPATPVIPINGRVATA